MNEFEFIHQYLQNKILTDEQLILGIGDDCATLKITSSTKSYWHISTDMMLEGKHFFAKDRAEHIAYKLLATNFSDLAAMGARPKWVMLSLALEQLDKNWLDAFFETFYKLLQLYQVKLIGGNTTKSDIKLFNITIMGESDTLGLQRNQALPTDDIWVTGVLGLSVAALYHHWGKIQLSPAEFEICEQARVQPPIRIDFMLAAKHLIHAALDLSDGLMQDLKHILDSSTVGATVHLENIPSANFLRQYPAFQDWVLNGGDDYEILFTAPKLHRAELEKIALRFNLTLSCIGEITAQKQCKVFNQGQRVNHFKKGFDHFEN